MKHVGIDISKIDFCASCNGNSKTFRQDGRGYNAYLNWLKKIGIEGAITVMEATGVYHLRFAMYLKKRGLLVDVVNPQRPYHHGRSQMARVVNDSSAARNIEDFAIKNSLKGRWVPMPDEIEQLRWWLKQADQKVANIRQLKNQIESLMMRPGQTDNRVKFLEEEIDHLIILQKECEDEAAALSSQFYADEAALFRSIIGVGPKTSLALVAFFCSHYEIHSPKQALVLAGLSVRRHTSGTSVNKKERISKMGYGYLRKSLYMCALNASKRNPSCKELYDRLLAQGKPKKVGLIAVACKLLRQAFGVWNSKTMFNVELSKGNLDKKIA